MKISNLVSDEDRHYLNNLLLSGKGEVPDENGNVSKEAEFKFVINKGFITGAELIIRGEKPNAIT